jgi:hypothetical protein
MALTFIPYNAGSYSCKSTDLSGGSVVGAKYIGAKLYVEDTGLWYIVSVGGGLVPYVEQTTTPAIIATGAKSVNLTLSASAGQAAIADSTRILSLFTTASAVRFGFEVPANSSGSSTGGSATLADFKNGIPLLPISTWLTYNVGYGVNRVLYFTSGSAASLVSIVQV